MLPKELLKKVRQIEIRTNRVVNDVFAGEYQSVFKGRGMEFQEVRAYVHGDEIRSIDWNVTARLGEPYVKEFSEERELTVMLLVDTSSSGKFGSVDKLKNEIAAELAAVLALSAVKSNDKVGLIIFTDHIEKYLPPKKGKPHVLRVIRELLYSTPTRTATDISAALEFLTNVIKRRAIIFLISDFLTEGFEKALRIVNKRHDVIAVTITDPREVELPKVGFIELQDAESGEYILVDTNDAEVRKEFLLLNREEIDRRLRLFRSMDVDSISVYTDRPYIDPIMKFFKLREKRRWKI